MLTHPLLETTLALGLAPFVQARLRARPTLWRRLASAEFSSLRRAFPGAV